MRRPISILAACLLMALVAAAQSAITGSWKGTTGGGAALTLDLTVKGTALTGTLTRNDAKTTISEGTVTRQSFTFKATLNEQTEVFAGELDGEQLKVWLERQGRESAISLVRSKSQPQK